MANITALMKKGTNEPAISYIKPMINGPGIFAILATEPAIPNMLPCSLREILLDRKAGMDVFIIPKPAASKEFAKKKTATFLKIGIRRVPEAINIGPNAISFSSPNLLESGFIKKPCIII